MRKGGSKGNKLGGLEVAGADLDAKNWKGVEVGRGGSRYKQWGTETETETETETVFGKTQEDRARHRDFLRDKGRSCEIQGDLARHREILRDTGRSCETLRNFERLCETLRHSARL